MDNRLDTTAGRIRFLRKKAGLKQEQLGEKLNVGKTTISNYENTGPILGQRPKFH